MCVAVQMYADVTVGLFIDSYNENITLAMRTKPKETPALKKKRKKGKREKLITQKSREDCAS